MKKILIILPIILLFHSCEKKIYFDIPQNEKPVLKNNDTVIFKSSNNNIDTFLIKLTNEYTVSDKRYYHENIMISFQKLNETSYFKRIYIQQGVDAVNISIDGYYFPTIYKNDNTINFNVGEITYTSVHVKQDNNFPNTIPHLIYYSHTNGILRYDYSDTIYFEMKNK